MKAFQKIMALAMALLLCLGLGASAYAGAEAEDPSWDEITARVMEEYNMTDSGVYCGYLNLVTDEEHYINGDEYAIAASMTKLPLCMYYTELLANGEFDWSPYAPYYSFEDIRDRVLIDSSNADYALLLDLLGGYDQFRLLTAHYYGVEPGSERIDITMYNNYTPREFITCLKLLYDEQERFPGIIETAQKAMTNQFFKLNEPRFRIAHKPGWISEDHILNDCALCFTTQPIAIVMMTRSSNTSEEFLSAWCTAMCEYTEKLANKPEPTPEPTPAPTPVPTPAAAPAAATSQPVPDRVALPQIVPAAAIGAFLLVGFILVIVLCVKYRARFIGLFLALMLSAGAMLLSAAGMYYGTLYAKPDGDPAETVTTFLDALCAGDYGTAYAQLRDYADLGLGERPASPAGQKVYDALHASYSYSLNGECRTDKLEAEQEGVRLVHLDLARLEQAVAEETQRQVEAIVQSRPTSAVYDENKRYRSEVADEAYLAALDVVLRDAPAYYSEAEFNLSLAYVGGRWQIIANPSLLRALAGGIGY